MLTLDHKKVFNFCKKIYDNYEKNLTQPLFYEPFIEKVLPVWMEQSETKYPITVKIAPPIERMLLGDFNPIKVIEIKEPFSMGMWSGNTTDGINVRLGYLNGDSRYPEAVALGDDGVHFKAGGRTGAGKSVALNNIICNMLFEYPPWELMLFLADFKQVELTRYAKPTKTPHVRAVAATKDIDYVITMIAYMREQMELREKLFADIGTTNIKGFREKTGLTMPRMLQIDDEVQTLFLMANNKQTAQIEYDIDLIVRKGRALGCHLGFASQEMKGTIKKESLANFKIGISLPADPEVSETLIGNPAAGDLKGKGKAILNYEGGKKEFNKNFRVPLIEEHVLEKKLIELSDLADKVGYRHDLKFYDESYRRTIEDFNTELDKLNVRGGDILVLGDTTRFKSEKLDLEYINLLRRDSENIFMASKIVDDQLYMAKLLALNFSKKSNVHHVVLYGDPTYKDIYNLSTDIPVLIEFSENKLNSDEFAEIVQMFRIRKAIVKGESLFRQVECTREQAITQVCISEGFPEEVVPLALKMRGKFGETFTPDMFSRVVFWVIGYDKVIGMGRNNDYKLVGALASLIMEAPAYGLSTILLGDKPKEVKELLGSCNHRFVNVIDEQEKNTMGVDFKSLAPILTLYANRVDLNRVFKFKKFLCEFSLPKEETLQFVE